LFRIAIVTDVQCGMLVPTGREAARRQWNRNGCLAPHRRFTLLTTSVLRPTREELLLQSAKPDHCCEGWTGGHCKEDSSVIVCLKNFAPMFNWSVLNSFLTSYCANSIGKSSHWTGAVVGLKINRLLKWPHIIRE